MRQHVKFRHNFGIKSRELQTWYTGGLTIFEYYMYHSMNVPPELKA